MANQDVGPGRPCLRKVGVEEELLLVDPDTGELTAVSRQAVRAHEHQASSGDGPEVEHELFQQQVETATAPCQELSDLHQEIRRGRRAVGRAARAAGARAVAVPTPVLGDTGHITPKPRYQRIRERYGELTRDSLVCAMHVHVDVSDDEEAVAVIDRVGPWLPVLLALSANSPYLRGRDTTFASWRSQAWGQWPSSGAAAPYGSVATYRDVSSKLIEWGAAMDPGMLYYDVRIAERYPTIEVRVADVCTEPEDAVLVAALSRALVETSARAWRSGAHAPQWRPELLRAASWRAARSGTADSLVHPQRQELAPVREVFDALVAHVGEALADAGDADLVRSSFERLLARGNGATRQRRVFEETGRLEAVVADLADRTEASWQDLA